MLLRALTFSIVFALARGAAAQPCAACQRGDLLVDQLSLQPLRPLGDELAALELSDPLTPEQYARIVALRRREPAFVRLGAVDEADFGTIAAALCKSSAPACTTVTARALRCLADRCEVAIPSTDAHGGDVLQRPACQSSQSGKRSAPLGVGLEWGTGWHHSRYPNDGRAWSLGIEARLRLTHRFATVARVDRIAGRDEATDADGNGYDDAWTGSITRIAALAGPSIVLDRTRFEDTSRFLRLDLLGGYLSTRSQPEESGPAAGFDLAYQLWILRVGIRFVQGFGDASDASMLLAHAGIVAGSAPPDRDDDCDNAPSPRRSSRLGIGVDYAMIGYGLSSELGLLAPGLGIELAWYLTPKLDAIARADLLLYPGYERERVIHQAALAGLRIDHGSRHGRSESIGFFSTVMSGYSHGAGFTPTSTGSGPIGEIAVGWGLKADEGSVWLRLHGRFGIAPDNLDYRTLFLSVGTELHFDPRQWRDGD